MLLLAVKVSHFIRMVRACKVNMVQLLRGSEVHALEISMFVHLPWAQQSRYTLRYHKLVILLS